MGTLLKLYRCRTAAIPPILLVEHGVQPQAPVDLGKP
jgi:hypothetical protein